MAYQQNGNKKFNNNRGTYTKNNGNHQHNDRPKNKLMKFAINVSGTDSNGRIYDANGALANLETLKDNGTFNMLSVPVSISRALLENDDTRRGSISVGFIRDIDIIDLTAEVSIFGKNVETIESMSLKFVPRMLIKNEKVITFLGFDLVAE